MVEIYHEYKIFKIKKDIEYMRLYANTQAFLLNVEDVRFAYLPIFNTENNIKWYIRK